MIISGGSNIYPREIEEVLLCHPDLVEASVVGRPHPDWGEEVIAFVVPRSGAMVEAAELDRLCLDRIARFKRPRDYRFVEALPKNNSQEQLWQGVEDRTPPPSAARAVRPGDERRYCRRLLMASSIRIRNALVAGAPVPFTRRRDKLFERCRGAPLANFIPTCSGSPGSQPSDRQVAPGAFCSPNHQAEHLAKTTNRVRRCNALGGQMCTRAEPPARDSPRS